MRTFLALITYLIAFYCQAEVSRWQKWELERNDLYLNPEIYHKLPKQSDLRSYQTETLFLLKVDPESIGLIFSDSAADPNVAAALKKLTTSDRKLKFFIHPKALNLFSELIKKGTLEEIQAIPTTSPRTFFVEDMIVKVSLPQKINGAIRTVYPLQMTRATSISQMLAKIPNFHFLAEPIGIYDKTPNSPFGFLVREIPNEIKFGKNTLVPILSFVANHPEGSLLEINAKQIGLTPNDLVKEKIIPALHESFFAAARHGIAIEAHQQNTLLELDERGNFTGNIYYRDLDGCRVDFDLRKKLGFDDTNILSKQDAAWAFDLDNVNNLNRSAKVPSSRPDAWSGLIEESYQTYLLGSSIHILDTKLKSLSKILPGLARSCSQVFMN